MPGKLLLNSWKEIAEFVGRTERTVQRWEKLYGLPVHRPAGRERSAVIALTSEIEAWSSKTSARGLNTAAAMPAASDDTFNCTTGNRTTGNRTTGSAATVLCIDSHPERLATRKKLLEFGGYRVLTAVDARTGLRLLVSNKVYVVILDYSVSDMDGEGVARAFQKHKPEVPVLMLSRKAKAIPQTILDLIGVSEQLRTVDGGVPVQS
jgi:CheY-like chemotaxis protein